MTTGTPVTVAYGDGIGPEIMRATLHVLDAAGARLDLERVEVGLDVYRDGHSSGIAPDTWESLRRTGVFLKGPITTPQGGGYKSLNVTIRKSLGMYANVRPCVAYPPFVATRHPSMDVVIVRENEEDLYAGIEHRQTDDVVQCLKLYSRQGCERIVRYAFEYARRNNRRKVSCFTKDNIMKLTDGLFHRVFEEVAAEYDLQHEHYIIDIGTALLADSPEMFDVIVLPNLYGDILSDVAAQLTGSVGLGGSANIGDHCAMFEAIHGSAPGIAGQDIANPSGLLLASVMMLVHIGQREVAELVHNAWLRTLEDGVHTADIYMADTSAQCVGTAEFGRAVVARLGQRPERLRAVRYIPDVADAAEDAAAPITVTAHPPADKRMVGVDVFVHDRDASADDLAERLQKAQGDDLQLLMISNRGVKVWPEGLPETMCVDHWRCRFQHPQSDREVDHAQVIDLLTRLADAGIDFVKTEQLYTFDGEPAYSLGQGQ